MSTTGSRRWTWRAHWQRPRGAGAESPRCQKVDSSTTSIFLSSPPLPPAGSHRYLYIGAREDLAALLYAGRFFTGVGAGLFSSVGPLYSAELSAPEMRGLPVVLPVSIIPGIMLSFWVGYDSNYIGGTGDSQSDLTLRLPSIIQGIPAAALALSGSCRSRPDGSSRCTLLASARPEAPRLVDPRLRDPSPLHRRSRQVGQQFAIAFVVPPMLEAWAWATYIFFAVFLVAGIAWVWFYLPETKKATLEEMDRVFKSHAGERDAQLLAETQRELGNPGNVVEGHIEKMQEVFTKARARSNGRGMDSVEREYGTADNLTVLQGSMFNAEET
ncbi:Sugar/inositol transporter [Tolypocladium paradoxum]|uniref:Sugar/inositol transporter n=1 Tax=Tolypocladium paradoxum TaxID=94208 RepID=A0A2S4KLB7_9HYPO|nr:Sugar/inositol transporter [Tolypocladium paradoxum]